jgi:hypothetical protein
MTGQARVESKSLIVEQLRVPVKSWQHFSVLGGCEMVKQLGRRCVFKSRRRGEDD